MEYEWDIWMEYMANIPQYHQSHIRKIPNQTGDSDMTEFKTW